MTAAAWATVPRNADPRSGSVILNAWLAEREAARGGPRNDVTSMSMSEFGEWIKTTDGYAPGSMSERTAMQISTVYACVNLIGGAIASMPLKFYRRGADGEREPYTPEEWWMLNEAPCPTWAAATAWEYATQSLLLRGDSLWRILRASRLSPTIVGFRPLHPGTVSVRRVEDRNAYDIYPQPDDPQGTRRVTIDQDDILHIPGPGFDGLRGLPQITSVLRGAGGIAAASDSFLLGFFRNSARPDYALETEQQLKKEQIDLIRAQIDERHQGAGNAFRPLVLHGGLKTKAITVLPAEMQLIHMRAAQVEEICRVFGVPPFMVGHTEKTTSWGSGVEEMSLGFVKYTLQRHLVKFEQEINRKIFRTARNFCEFHTAGLERGDIKRRFEAYRIALGRAGEQPWMAYDEVRRIENLPARDGLKVNAGSAKPEQDDPDKKEKDDDEPAASTADR